MHKPRVKREPYIPYSIDAAATKAEILAIEPVAHLAKRLKISGPILCMILNGKYPESTQKKSKFQAVLRKLFNADFLVQKEQPLDEAA